MKKLCWSNILFHTVFHLALIVGTPLFILYGEWSWLGFWITFGLYIIGGLCVTFGFHRLFSHRSFVASKQLETIVLWLSSISFMGSALNWSHGHRIHHAKTDTDEDPYSIKKGFFYAHMAWMWVEKKDINKGIVSDLLAKPWVMFQHKHFFGMTIVVNGLILIACVLLTDWFVALYMCLVVRVLFIHHSTYLINSLAHTWGSRSYARELTAVDNFILALLSFGEGYHNYHHAFPNDYRNGIRWYHYDPTKWLIIVLQKLGLAKNLKTNNPQLIRRNLVRKDVHIFLEEIREKISDVDMKEILCDKLENLNEQIQARYTTLQEKMIEYRKLKESRASKADIVMVKIEIKQLKKEFSIGWKSWVRMIQHLERDHKITPAHQH